MPANISKEHLRAVERLQKLAEEWPEDLMLFSFSGSLDVVRMSDGLVITTIQGIPNDGGDPTNWFEGGDEYLELPYWDWS